MRPRGAATCPAGHPESLPERMPTYARLLAHLATEHAGLAPRLVALNVPVHGIALLRRQIVEGVRDFIIEQFAFSSSWIMSRSGAAISSAN